MKKMVHMCHWGLWIGVVSVGSCCWMHERYQFDHYPLSSLRVAQQQHVAQCRK